MPGERASFFLPTLASAASVPMLGAVAENPSNTATRLPFTHGLTLGSKHARHR